MSLRTECIQTLYKILVHKVFFKELKENFKPEDRPFAGRLILTALRRKPVIDKLLDSILVKKIKAKDQILAYILCLGAVEILYMDTPTYAVINEYVNAAKKMVGSFASKMVNAVLHKIEVHKNEMQNKAEFPADFENILRQDYSANQIQKMQKMLLFEAPLDITAFDPLKTHTDLGGILFENGTIRLLNPKSHPSLLKGYQEGQWFVQDLAASLPISMLGKLNGKKVLDLCAAPGGKTAQLLAKGANVTALDIDASRLDILKENMNRLGFKENLNIICEDALVYLQNTAEKYDLIVIDAPCSATGTFRKHPEIMYFKTLEDVQKQAKLQKQILDASIGSLSNDGKILYMTCSIAKKEGETQIENFLKEHTDFETEAFDMKNMLFSQAQKLSNSVLDKGVLRTLPYDEENSGGMDSFFAAIVKRKDK